MNTFALVALSVLAPLSANDAASAAERGRVALTTRLFTPAIWTMAAYKNAWQTWQPPLKEAPRDYDRAFREHYGLHPAPYANGGVPMGLRPAASLLVKSALGYDCMLCHAGSIAGTSYIGLGNSALDLQAVFEDFGKASGSVSRTPFPFSNVRGTSEAGAAAVFLLSYRNPDLSLRLTRLDLGLHFDMCEDTPAWWLLKKKKTMYHTGTTSARSVRALMQFMLSPANSAATIMNEESTFRDIQAFLLSLEPPKYPFPIDHALAAQGQKIFTKTCARCHGTYGADWTYPNKIVPIEIIGTDRKRLDGLSPKLAAYYNKSWFALETGIGHYAVSDTVGYQAPPLDGVWATAPYLHNGSVPTLYDMLNSKTRPKLFTRSFTTGAGDYDQIKVGWKITELGKAAPPGATPYERRRIYDTTQPGRGNGGHTFGDKLTESERRAVIEYLKTL